MEQLQTPDQVRVQPTEEAVPCVEPVVPRSAVIPQASAASCPTCRTAQSSPSANAPSYVYAIGQIEPRFPLPSVEKEFVQVRSRAGADTAKLTDREVMLKVLRENRYLVRQLCWVLSVQGIETCILIPRDPADYQLLLDSYRASRKTDDLDVVIGLRGPISTPTMCNGLLVPVVLFDQIYSFDRKSLIEGIPLPHGADTKTFTHAAGEMFDRIMLQSDNAGATSADIAKNYLAVRYHHIYATAADALSKNQSLASIEVLPSPLSGTRNIVDVVFAFTDRSTDVMSKYFVRVDVTDEFPFLVSKMSPYFDR